METGSIIAIAVAASSAVGTFYVMKYRVGQAEQSIEGLKKDFKDLMAALHENAKAIGELTMALKFLAQGEETVDDHETRLRVLESGRRCGDCASFKAHA